MSILLFVLYLLTAIKKRDAAFIFFGLAESFVVLPMPAFYALSTGTDAPFCGKYYMGSFFSRQCPSVKYWSTGPSMAAKTETPQKTAAALQ